MKLLRIAILAQLKSPTITQQLAPLLRDRGHIVDIINLSGVPSENFTSHPDIVALANYDIVYYRSGLEASVSPVRIIMLEEFLKNTSVQTVNLHYTEHPKVHSKTYEIQEAEKSGLTVPVTNYTAGETFDTLSAQLGLPFVSKTDGGTNGVGVHLVATAEKLLAVQTRYQKVGLFYQAFIPHDFEYRVHIMDGVVVCIWKKAPKAGDFRSNEAQGGAMLVAEPQYTPQLTELAKVVFATFSFEIFVADFMLDPNTGTFYFTEINLNPGWGKTDHAAAGVDVISLTADYFEKICSE